MKNRYPQKPLARIVGSLFLTVTSPAWAAPDNLAIDKVEVVATTPLPGMGLAKEQIAAAVQTANSRALEKSGALDLADFINRNLGSVHVNEVQGNPFMADVSYRGYTASPLLGTPQGLSVYLDGVRMNQPFGDVVMWDLIPKNAIANVTLMSGANPLFGLNTLGGALSLQTKDGLSHPGSAVELVLGSHGRRSLSIEHGGANDKGLDWFITANSYAEDGWRDVSPSRLGQVFGKLGWHDAKSELRLTYAWASNKLNGNGAQEQQLLASNYNSVYTKPDTTENRAGFFNLEGKTSLSDNVLLSGNAYYRNTRTSTLNGDLNEEALGQAVYYTGQAADRNWLSSHGFGTPAAESSNSRINAAGVFPRLRCISQASQNIEPNEKCTGLINTTSTHQENYGVSGQVTFLSEAKTWRNQAVIGAGFDASRIHFNQATQFGYLNPDRSITPVNAFADGTQTSENAFDQRVNLDGKVRTWSVYGSDTLTLGEVWHITASGRYNETRLKNTDNLYPYNNALIDPTLNPGGLRGSLDGDHTFRRFNPALGVSWAPSKALTAYVGYSESSRAPTSIELGCADPNFGCRLPNSMAGDPALNQVVSKTWEMGLRGKLAGQTNWNIDFFRGDNFDDILFVANSAATGYFKNFGQTRRQGVELGLSGSHEQLSFSLNYTWMKATYQSSDVLGAQYNSTADGNGGISVNPGDQIPLMPRHIFKARVDYAFRPDTAAGLEMVAMGSSFVRGNENNQHQADGVNFLGAGKIPGYAVFNLSASYQPSKQLKLFANVSNLLDRRYYTAGQLGPYAINANGSFNNSTSTGTSFFSPGAPRSVSLGARYSF